HIITHLSVMTAALLSYSRVHVTYFLFFFNDAATTEIYTLSLHDALPICVQVGRGSRPLRGRRRRERTRQRRPRRRRGDRRSRQRSEEHTSELQSLAYLVCRLLLEKKKNKQNHCGHHYHHIAFTC